MRFKLVVAACSTLAFGGCASNTSVPVHPPAEERAQALEIDLAQARLYASREKVWVCHRGRWQDISGVAAAAHMRHGDVISEATRERGLGC